MSNFTYKFVAILQYNIHMKLTLILIITLVQGLILFIPQDKVLDRRANFPKQITKHGRKLITCIIITITCTIILFFISEKEATDFDKRIKSRDSLVEINRKNDAENYEQKLIKANTENRKVLLEYGLEMDAKNEKLQKAVEKNRDTTYRGVAPYLELYKMDLIDSISNNKYVIKYTFTATGATCYNIKVKMDFILVDFNGNLSYWYKNYIPITTSQDIEKGKGYSTYIDLPKSNLSIKSYYFHVYGTYKNQSGAKLKIDKFYALNILDQKNRFGSPLQIWKDKLDTFVSKND